MKSPQLNTKWVSFPKNNILTVFLKGEKTPSRIATFKNQLSLLEMLIQGRRPQ